MNTESMKAELARLQAENDKLRGQVEGLKDAIRIVAMHSVTPLDFICRQRINEVREEIPYALESLCVTEKR